MEKLQFEHNGTVYEFADLTIAQMEILSQLITNARDLLQEVDIEKNAIKVAVTINDVIQKLREQKKLALFCAACVVKKGQVFDEKDLPEREKEFKTLPYKTAEEILSFFFNTGIFTKLITPSFLMSQADLEKAQTTM
ncbi:hypothetical protein Calab_1447 [Caldithrix abyssi DSM 13497]|uniref:Uncharacterized protein n=1 Tax=Caldithrix abyssi DSM 13497 TaxID=880073 RepID=H1XPU2_CALAY|nr:hypothetical protein [Caldithrix abyssi]APF20404.1 hypothetical protein Cabys_3658 [Caldithrix abyssi DSM 13497]EHO41068.1 hypothetical protein Calab_1447 [Caldithrix abyssi DSM 13497]